MKGIPKNKDSISNLLASSVISGVQSDHVWNAVQLLLNGNVDHGFGLSTDYDLIADGGIRLPPKAVFGLAATNALGFKVLPKHFDGGNRTPCFRIMRAAGFSIVPKGDEFVGPGTDDDLSNQNAEWAEGGKRLRLHYARERGRGLSQAKKAAFKRKHGRLFCERCKIDPIQEYGGVTGESCIEVHHKETAVANMAEGHITVLGDLMCLCANCHRVAHRKLRDKRRSSRG